MEKTIVEIKDKEFQRALRGLNRGLVSGYAKKTWKRHARRIVDKIRKDVRDRFRDKKDSDGKRWKPLARSTIVKRRMIIRDGGLLVQKGGTWEWKRVDPSKYVGRTSPYALLISPDKKLERGIKVQHRIKGGHRFVIYSRYGRIHYFGGKPSGEGQHNIPSRRFIDAGMKEVKLIAREVEKWWKNYWNRA